MAGDLDYDLHRFIEAQNGIYKQALAELATDRPNRYWK